MNNNTKRHLPVCLLAALLLIATACKQGASKAAESKPATPLTMEQNEAGKWVVLDAAKTPQYEVFPFDNGPDYPAEGLIRVLKNGKIGYADAQDYTIVIAPQFDCAYPFENGKARVSNQCQTSKDGEHSVWTSDAWRYVDRNGNYVE